jgi:hypothetical protein
VHSAPFVGVRAAAGFLDRTRRIEQVGCGGRQGRGEGEQAPAALVAGACWRYRGMDTLASAVRRGSFRGGTRARMSRFRCGLSCWTTWRRRVRRWFRENVSAAAASTPALCRSLMLDACGFCTVAGETVADADPSPMTGMNSLARTRRTVSLGSSTWYWCCEGAVRYRAGRGGARACAS